VNLLQGRRARLARLGAFNALGILLHIHRLRLIHDARQACCQDRGRDWSHLHSLTRNLCLTEANHNDGAPQSGGVTIRSDRAECQPHRNHDHANSTATPKSLLEEPGRRHSIASRKGKHLAFGRQRFIVCLPSPDDETLGLRRLAALLALERLVPTKVSVDDERLASIQTHYRIRTKSSQKVALGTKTSTPTCTWSLTETLATSYAMAMANITHNLAPQPLAKTLRLKKIYSTENCKRTPFWCHGDEIPMTITKGPLGIC